jgi:hypothetical protein
MADRGRDGHAVAERPADDADVLDPLRRAQARARVARDPEPGLERIARPAVSVAEDLLAGRRHRSKMENPPRPWTTTAAPSPPCARQSSAQTEAPPLAKSSREHPAPKRRKPPPVAGSARIRAPAATRASLTPRGQLANGRTPL